MKKVLLATTALVLSAGVAAAEVALSGDARMGVVYDGADWQFSSRARAAVAMSGTTDSGLEFGANFQIDDADSEAANVFGAENGTAGSVYISGAFGKIEMGDVVSAPEALFGDLYEVGYTDLAANDIPYLTLDDNTQSAMLYTYSAGAFSVAASLTDDTSGAFGDTEVDTEESIYGVAGAYTMGDYTVGLGYEDNGTVSQVELAGMAKVANVDVKAYYADQEDGVVDTAYGLSAATTFGATTVGGFIQRVNYVAVDTREGNYYGIGASYDLGGGASIVGGIADNTRPNTDAVADLGVTFKF